MLFLLKSVKNFRSWTWKTLHCRALARGRRLPPIPAPVLFPNIVYRQENRKDEQKINSTDRDDYDRFTVRFTAESRFVPGKVGLELKEQVEVSGKKRAGKAEVAADPEKPAGHA